MKRRQLISYMLLLVCMIMLTASVVPHHHHQQMICLQHDMTECACSCANSHHSHDNEMSDEHHSCSASCITKFSSVTPHDMFVTFSPDYSNVTILFSIHDILDLLSFPGVGITDRNYYYLEHLHSNALYQSTGLRAPPYSVI